MSPILLMTADTSGIFTTTVVIAGISIVVGVLLLLILVFALFGKIVPIIDKKATQREAKKVAKKAAKKAAKNESISKKPENTSAPKASTISKEPAPAAPVVEAGISGEVVAAIAAAVVATEGSGAVIRSIKKKNVGGRNPWAQAANIDNTRPF